MSFFQAAIAVVLSLLSAPALASTEPPKAPQVSTVLAALEELFEQLTYPARVESRVNANILSEGDGVVTRVLAPLGTRVARNQPVLEIRHTDPVYDYASLLVRAPVAGVVSQIVPDIGSRIQRGDLVARVTDPTKLKITIEVAAIDLPHFRSGLAGELELPGRDKALPVALSGVSAFVDPATGTAACELRLTTREEAESRGLLPGMIGKARFRTQIRQGLSIPDHAVFYRGSEPALRLVREGKARYVAVKLGRKQAGRVEILEGLSKGDVVIERAAGFVGDGQDVSVREPAQKEGAGK